MKGFLTASLALVLMLGIPILVYQVGQTVSVSPFETRTITILIKK